MDPKWLPKSSQNRSWDHLGLRNVPKMVQESPQPPILLTVGRFWLHIWPISVPFLVGFEHPRCDRLRNQTTKTSRFRTHPKKDTNRSWSRTPFSLFLNCKRNNDRCWPSQVRPSSEPNNKRIQSSDTSEESYESITVPNPILPLMELRTK